MTPAQVDVQAFVPEAREFLVTSPETIVAAAAILVLIAVLAPGRTGRRAAPWIAGIGLASTFIPLVSAGVTQQTAFGGMMITDGFAVVVKSLLAVTGILAILISQSYLKRENLEIPEYYALMLFSIAGMMMITSSADLIMVFLSLEILSIALYVMTGYARTQAKSEEAAMKYFLLGSFASAFLLYGVALVYGSSQTTRLAGIAASITELGIGGNPMLLAGMGLITVGLAFKVSAVPFQMWTPDVYDGAPSPVTAFMSVAAKAAGFAALARIFSTAFGDIATDWIPVVWALALLTMIVGNVVAIAQANIKRMLAYSSIAHAGYLLMAIVAANQTGLSSLLFYLIAYAFMNLGAWAVVIIVGRKGESHIGIGNYAGLSRRSPALAGAMALFMISLIGLPPTAGFMAKFYVFSAALQAGHVGLVVIGVLTSLVSAYYYLRITVMMFMHEPSADEAPLPLPSGLLIAVGVTAAATLLLGIFPNALFQLTGIARIAAP